MANSVPTYGIVVLVTGLGIMLCMMLIESSDRSRRDERMYGMVSNLVLQMSAVQRTMFRNASSSSVAYPTLALERQVRERHEDDGCGIVPQSTPKSGLQSEHLYDAYVGAVELALSKEAEFQHFKQAEEYRHVLEHVTRNEGHGYIENIERWLRAHKMSASILPVAELERLDALGDPTRYDFQIGGDGVHLTVSPTTLRYLWYAMDYTEHARKVMPTMPVRLTVAEVGAGYAGQYLVWQALIAAGVLGQDVRLGRYTIFDLEPVQRLQMKYVQRARGGLDGILGWANVSTWSPHYVDLLVSNYALSELAPRVQRLYWTRLAPWVSHGYLARNAPLVDCPATREALTRAVVREEYPQTGQRNEIVAW